MVKRVTASIVEDKDDEDVVNENGKRSGEDNKDGKKRIKTKSLYRQPTANELNRLQETENLFNSNLFRLQVEEVLAEVKVKDKTVKRFKEWLATLKDHLMSIVEDDFEYDLSEKKFTKHLKVKLPICAKLQTTKVIFKFHKFTDIEIVGSYALECSINSKLTIDLQIVIPTDVYTKNDSINYKYHLKRAAYMAYVVNHLKKLDTIEELHYTCLNGSETKPLIKIKPKGKLSNISVLINFVCDTETYKLHRFSPSRNNLRESWLYGGEHKENELMHPTPYYNSSILADLTSEPNQGLLKNTLTNSDNLRQAIVLLKIWARQRELNVSGYILSMLVVHLVQIKRINNIMSSYQIVRNVWIALKSSEWDTKGITLCKREGTPSLEEFKEYFPVVFLDSSGYYNMCWQMSKGTYDALRRESSLAVDMLDNSKINSFTPLFMTSVKPLLKFDHILKFKDIASLKASILERSPKQTRLNYGLDELTLVTDTLHALFCKGLTKRVDLIQPMVEADITWPVNKTLDKSKLESDQRLSFGMILNPEHALSIVDRGPPANLPEAEEFRSFWGSKSELRRFQDGAITEAVVWSADSDAERRALLTQVVEYLLQDKYDIPPEQQFHVCGQLNGLLRVKALDQPAAEAAAAVLDAFNDLRRDLRALRLPLDVSAVNGISPVFSYCEPAPPGPALHGGGGAGGGAPLLSAADLERGLPYVPANRAVIELTHSGKWPGDLEAFRCLKAAFHLQISDGLRQQYSLVTQAYPTHLDVLKNGLVFRLKVAHPKEVTLVRRQVEAGVVKSLENEESRELQCRTVLLPRLRGALHGLHSKYPAFGPTACLFRRWAASHLLAPPLSAPLSELLAAAAFVRPPLAPPAQPTLAFLRVLRLLADTDWTREMVIVDFNDDMTREEMSELEREFSEREERPAMHVVTSYDGALPGVWSARVTSRHLARARALARATAEYIERQLEGMQHNLLGAFVPSLAGYDVLLHLRRALVPHAAERLDEPARSGAPSPDGASPPALPVVDWDPVKRYLRELRHAYGQWALFCHDEFGGDVIAVLWTEGANERTDLQILNASGLRPVLVNGETKYELNKEALVEDFRRMGEGLVTRVQVCG